MSFKEYSFLDKAILISFPDEWLIKKKEPNLTKINFPFGPYPSLDCYFNCFDAPKVNTETKIKNYLLDGTENAGEVKSIGNNTYTLNYKFKSNGESLLLWKVISVLKPRSFREVRFSLAWPENIEANKIVEDVSKKLTSVIDNIKFNKEKTDFDEIFNFAKRLSLEWHKRMFVV